MTVQAERFAKKKQGGQYEQYRAEKGAEARLHDEFGYEPRILGTVDFRRQALGYERSQYAGQGKVGYQAYGQFQG